MQVDIALGADHSEIMIYTLSVNKSIACEAEENIIPANSSIFVDMSDLVPDGHECVGVKTGSLSGVTWSGTGITGMMHIPTDNATLQILNKSKTYPCKANSTTYTANATLMCVRKGVPIERTHAQN